PTYDEAAHKLRELLREAVRERLAADVPVGAFLSGGYDSSLITAIAKEVSGQPVRTFSIGFHEEAYNEAKYAKEVAEYLGCDHRELYVDEADMLSMVESIPLYYDEPFADSSQIPSMLVSKLARQEVTVVLSGDGGDELFCGYSIYERVRQAQRLDGVGALAKTVGDAFGVTEKYPFKVRAIAGNRNKETKTQLVNENCRKAALEMVLQSPEGEALPCTYDRESTYRERNWQIRRMLLDMETYLPEDILCKVDRASMMVSLEARCPILDKNVIEYALGLPHVFKYHNGEKKRILKRLAYEYIPRPLLDRPKKGFSVPLDGWLRGPLREQLLSFSEKEYLERQGIFHPVYTTEFVRRYMEKGDGGAGSGENYSRLLWAYLMFQKWNEYWKKEWKQV
ncbi:MAG: 7-cyano-7-deazaguanine synthase, partial [Lachnospiraceae bacterium]|nr:7-cyano-7-deazaguanine synthase [Lachnospiraceae bacterium]